MQDIVSGTWGGPRPRVLISEDDKAIRMILKHWISTWGYEVIETENGAEAWEILQQERPPEFVIMDWEMPGLDGIELCRRLRSKSRNYYHYILMVTSRTDQQDVVFALESGADDCIGKPFPPAELRARLLVGSRILALQNELIHAREELRLQSMRDGLTGLWNRNAFLDLFGRELGRAKRAKGHTGLLMLDIDHFKRINDTYGHQAGDFILQEVARRLRNNVRSYDTVGRYGGEEFFIAMTGCCREQLCLRAEIIRRAISDEPVTIESGDQVSLTVSIGAIVAAAEDESPSDVVAIADMALYKAKNAGRNCLVYCDKPRTEIPQDSATTHGAICQECDPLGLAVCVKTEK